MLATASIGAIWSSCSPDFGVEAVLDRFGQIAPKVLFATDGYFYNGKSIDSLPAVARDRRALAGARAVVVVPYRAGEPELRAISRMPCCSRSSRTRTPRRSSRPCHSASRSTSCIRRAPPARRSASCTAPAARCCSIARSTCCTPTFVPGDVVFYFTTCGWMMWNWLVSALASGATLVLYEGAPLHPDPGVLWRLAERERINVFGTSARYLERAREIRLRAAQARSSSRALRTVLSTGSPLAPSSFDFVYRDVKQDLQLSSIAGGTDLISCFALGNPAPACPSRRAAVPRPRHEGGDLRRATAAPCGSEKGELVCTAPFPSMPIGFWNDPDGRKYRAAYFERFPNVWCHGDYAELTATAA